MFKLFQRFGLPIFKTMRRLNRGKRDSMSMEDQAHTTLPEINQIVPRWLTNTKHRLLNNPPLFQSMGISEIRVKRILSFVLGR